MAPMSSMDLLIRCILSVFCCAWSMRSLISSMRFVRSFLRVCFAFVSASIWRHSRRACLLCSLAVWRSVTSNLLISNCRVWSCVRRLVARVCFCSASFCMFVRFVSSSVSRVWRSSVLRVSVCRFESASFAVFLVCWSCVIWWCNLVVFCCFSLFSTAIRCIMAFL